MKTLKYFFSVILLLTICCGQLRGQEDKTDIISVEFLTLEELLNMEVITASRTAEKLSDAPATIISISEMQIEKYGWKDLKDMFKALPGFNVSYNTQGEINSIVIMRGILGNQKILILQDGKKYNPTTGERFVYGHNIPLHAYKRIEIVYGPASALYGADAFSGVINMITKDGADVDGIETSAGYVSSGAFVSNFLFGKQIDDVDFILSGRVYKGEDVKLHKDYADYGDIVNSYNGSLGDLENSYPIDNWNLLFKLKYKKFTIGGDWQHSLESNAYTTIPTQYAYVKNNVWGQDLRHLYIEYKDDLSDKVGIDARIETGEYEVNPASNFYIVTNTNLSEGIPSYKYSYSGYVKGVVQFDAQLSDNFSILTGLSYEDVTSFPKTKNLDNVPYHLDGDLVDDLSLFVDDNGYTFGILGLTESKFTERNYTNFGFFAQASLTLSDKLNVILGGRYDYNSIYEGTINPRAGVVFKPIQKLSIKALLGTAYIAPSNYYRWENWANPYAMHIPNQDIEPEKLTNYSLSATYYATDNFSIRAEFFRNDLTDVIRPIAASAQEGNYPYYNPLAISGDPNGSFLNSANGYFVEINANQGKIHTQGFELETIYMYKNLIASLSYSYLDGEDNGNDIGKISNHIVVANIDYITNKLTLALTVRYFSDVQTLVGNSAYAGGTLDGSTIAYANAIYKINEKFEINVSVDNIFNTKHYTAAPYGESIWIQPRAPQPLRVFYMGINAKF